MSFPAPSIVAQPVASNMVLIKKSAVSGLFIFRIIDSLSWGEKKPTEVVLLLAQSFSCACNDLD